MTRQNSLIHKSQREVQVLMNREVTHLAQHTTCVKINWMTPKGLITQWTHHVGSWRTVTHIKAENKHLLIS